MRSHFEKYAFLHHILVSFSNYIAEVLFYAKILLLLVQNCCDIKSRAGLLIFWWPFIAAKLKNFV